MRTTLVHVSVLIASASFAGLAISDIALGDDAVSIHSAGIDRLLVDEKDAALLAALHMIGDRLLELPAETEQPDMPGDLLKLAADLFMGPMSLRMSVIPGVDPNEAPPFRIQWVFGAPDAETARQRAGVLRDTLQGMSGVEPTPHPTLPDMHMFDADGVPIGIGSVRNESGSGTVFLLNQNEMLPPEAMEVGLPEGVTPAMLVRVDLAEIQPLLDQMMAQAGPEGDAVRTQLAMMGLTGDQPLKVMMAMGHGKDSCHTVVRMENYLANELNAALVSKKPLTKKEIDLIPADATMAQIGHGRLSGLSDYFQGIFESMPEEQRGGVEDPFVAIHEQTGIDFKADLIDHLGETAGYYVSDTTGGGGLLSAVAFVEVTNEPAMRETLARIADLANQAAATEARGYVQFRNRRIDGRDIVTLSFPGLPVPLEVSSAVSDGYLFIGATPQALLGALEQARRGGSGLSDNPRFADAAGGKFRDAVSVAFIDNPRLLASGYGLMSLAMSAVANGVQSPADPSRDPGAIMPSYPMLARNAQATVALTWFEGDDMVYHARSDRSMLVNLCGAAGAMGSAYGGVVVAALGAGIMLPAIAKARDAAQNVRSSTQLRQVHVAAVTYGQEHGGRFPKGLQPLVGGGFVGEGLLVSPYGPCWDGEGDFWFDFRGQESNFEPDRIIGYDRAMASQGGMVNVLFDDGHVETLQYWDFLDRIQSPRHADVDFNLPGQ